MIEDRGTVKVSVNELKRLYTDLSEKRRALNIIKAALIDMGNIELASVLDDYNLTCEMSVKSGTINVSKGKKLKVQFSTTSSYGGNFAFANPSKIQLWFRSNHHRFRCRSLLRFLQINK